MSSPNSPTPSASGPSSTGSRWWKTALAAGTAAAFGLVAAHNSAWAAGIGTAVALFTAVREATRR